ncbi:hypothetical protein DE146DRAFT_635274 [Phaeosphaeria sp. MPI-PUGE-AT-0046c]|nr:hypothetical protein DE146DRAFT_635274 [Phaeosphaeria sp. MPI-PUGE-AT-0046c]
MGDLRPAILATNSLLIVLSSAAIACRVGRRIFLVRSFSWHDALITVAAVSATIFSILQMISTRFGAGLPFVIVADANLETIFKVLGLSSDQTRHDTDSAQLAMASRIFYFICNWAVKHSLLLFYATLTIDRIPRISINFMHFVAFGFGMTCIWVTIFQCNPIRKMWRHEVPGRCVNVDDFNYFNSCFMLATDLVLYAMPLVFTWKLNVSRPQRIAVNLLFALGGLVLAASGTRIYFVHTQATKPDFTYRFSMTMLCAVIENHLAIIVACAPSIKVILLHLFPGLEAKFEKLVSKGTPENSDFSIAAIALDLEHDAGSVGTVTYVGRPPSMRTTTDESGRCRHNARKWWRPPSSWEVNKEGKDEGVFAETKTFHG